MVRPKANTPEGRRATEKWRKTMVEKYGEEGVTEMFRQIGSIGGRATGCKGFAANPQLAKEAGAKGGKISRRTGVSTGQGKQKEYVRIDMKFIDPTEAPKHIEPSVETKPKKSFFSKIFRRK